MRIESSATSISWIPSEAVQGYLKAGFTMGFAHYDEPPPEQIDDLEALRDSDSFRFANRLTAWAQYDGDRVVDYGQGGGLVMGSTTVRVGFADATYPAVAMPELRPDALISEGKVTVRQTVGGRTGLPAPRYVRRAPFFRLNAPLVWTTLSVTLRSDGRCESALTGASPFPRHWVYDHRGHLCHKAGVADFSRWFEQPSRKATPWGDQDSPVIVTAAESALERRLSVLMMHGAAAPAIRTLSAGKCLVKEGDAADALFLVLDGVLCTSVAGQEIDNLGPGAVVGERAILEGSRRTATLTALTAVRVAEVPATAIDKDSLAELAHGHRRERHGTEPSA